MPKTEPSSHNKGYKKEKRKLKRIDEGSQEPPDTLKYDSGPADSAPEARATGTPRVHAEEVTTPQKQVTQLAKAAHSRHDLGPKFEPIQIEPALDCSEYDAETHELWLFQLPMDWRFDEKASISMRKVLGGACAGHFADARGDQFLLREEDASLAAPMYIASASHKVPYLRCNRRITVTRDHSSKHEPAEGKPGQEEAPATPSAASKKKRKAVTAETPSKAIGPDSGVQLHLDDILAAEASPTGKQGTPADGTPKAKKKKKQKKGSDTAGE